MPSAGYGANVTCERLPGFVIPSEDVAAKLDQIESGAAGGNSGA
jgi:hypothetical protein